MPSLALTRRALMVAATSTVAGAARADARNVEVESLAAGSRFETRVHLVDSTAEGPTVAIIAGIHGNETAPPNAADALVTEPIDRGRLWLVPRANQPALAATSRYTPKSTHADLNRNFPTATRAEPRGDMAKEGDCHAAAPC